MVLTPLIDVHRKPCSKETIIPLLTLSRLQVGRDTQHLWNQGLVTSIVPINVAMEMEKEKEKEGLKKEMEPDY